MATSEESLILQECLTYRNIVLLSFANLAQAELFGVAHRLLSKVTSHEVPACLYSGYHGILSIFALLNWASIHSITPSLWNQVISLKFSPH